MWGKGRVGTKEGVRRGGGGEIKCECSEKEELKNRGERCVGLN